MTFNIDYILGKHGWANVRFSNSATQCGSSVSYLHDSLGHMAAMALDLVDQVPTTKSVFMEEPGEVQFVVNLKGSVAAYEIRYFEDWASWGMHPEDKYKLLLSGTCEPEIIIQQIRNSLNEIYKNIGPEEYKNRWIEHDFPTEKYIQLMRL